MLSSYDLKTFAERLRTIRKSLGYSQNEVSDKTGINSDTLRRLENGMSIPRFETLEVLSNFYKENLILILDSYKTSSELSYFYDLVDYHITNADGSSIRKTILSCEQYLSNTNPQLIDSREIKQLIAFFEGIELSYHNTSEGYSAALDKLIASLKVSNPSFTLHSWESFKYNSLELRILSSIASVLGLTRECELSNQIMLMILDYLDTSKYAKHFEKLLTIKTYSTLSYNYHRIDQHDSALRYANIGIEYCIEHSIMAELALLLYRKAVAMFHLNIENYEKFFFQSIELLKIQGKDNLAEQYEMILHRYVKSDTNASAKEF